MQNTIPVELSRMRTASGALPANASWPMPSNPLVAPVPNIFLSHHRLLCLERGSEAAVRMDGDTRLNAANILDEAVTDVGGRWVVNGV